MESIEEINVGLSYFAKKWWRNTVGATCWPLKYICRTYKNKFKEMLHQCITCIRFFSIRQLCTFWLSLSLLGLLSFDSCSITFTYLFYHGVYQTPPFFHLAAWKATPQALGPANHRKQLRVLCFSYQETGNITIIYKFHLCLLHSRTNCAVQY